MRSKTATASGFDVALAPARATWRGLTALDRFVRLHFLGFSTLLVLLGAAPVLPAPPTSHWIGLLLGALCFHCFAYVLNDVVDLPVDRTQPLRRDDYLVRGVIRPWQALAFAVLQVPAALAVTLALGGGREAAGALVAGFLLMTVYNLWGKRCPVPPVTDLAQGLGWGSLALWGAWVSGGPPTVLSWTAFAYGAGFILLINGVHGGLRDLDNDLAAGRLTTAAFFGVRPGAKRAGAGLSIFAGSVQLLLVALPWWPLLRNDFGYGPVAWWTTAAVVTVLDLACLVYMVRVLRPGSPTWQRDFRIHLFLLLFTLPALFLPYLEAPLLQLLLVLFFWPLIFLDITYEVLGDLAARLGARTSAERA